MAFKMKGYSAFTKTDSPKKQKEIKTFIKNNMNNMTNEELIAEIDSMSDGETKYNWDLETGEVETKKNK